MSKLNIGQLIIRKCKIRKIRDREEDEKKEHLQEKKQITEYHTTNRKNTKKNYSELAVSYDIRSEHEVHWLILSILNTRWRHINQFSSAVYRANTVKNARPITYSSLFTTMAS